MLEVQDMRLSFSRYRTLLRREWLPVLNGVSVSVQRGELVSLIGASGAGKSLLAHAVLGILPSTTKLSGSMQFEGQPLTPARQNALRGKRIALVPQAITYLDPTARANAQVSWAATAAKLGTGAVASKLAMACPKWHTAAFRTSSRAAWRGACSLPLPPYPTPICSLLMNPPRG